MVFWGAAIGIAAIVALLLALAILRARPSGDAAAASDVQVYRDQLREVDRDVARGVLTEAEAEAVRIEVSRRLLEADRKAQGTGAETLSGPSRGIVAALTGALVLGGGLGLYWLLGAPLYPDMPLSARIEAADDALANRPGQDTAEAEAAANLPPALTPEPAYAELMEKLRAATAERPDDLQGHVLLARNEAALGNFRAARRAQERVIAIKGDTATAEDFAGLVDLMVIAAGGFVSPEAEAAIGKLLERDAANGTARYYLGLMFAQTGRPDRAFALWQRLLSDSAPGAPWVPPVRAQIEELAMLAGVDYVLPATGGAPTGRGPSAEDIEAAGEMSAADRMAMIENMVAGLSDRLATEGGPPEDWARLIRAYGVLGRRDAAAAIWAEAQTVFPDDAARLPILEAARAAGVAQ
ncbi:MAG: c-type cytochrome biogenesis protein CcmI [Rhodobacteraceae bacterium]|nr:c-type cytochrome biogenesis protein CcmI [Paracoccaceae bacterium]